MPLNGHIKLEVVVLRITPFQFILSKQLQKTTIYTCKKQIFVQLKFRVSGVNLPSGLYGTRSSSHWNRMSVRKQTGYNTVTNLTKCVQLWRGSNLAKSTCPTVNQARRWYWYCLTPFYAAGFSKLSDSRMYLYPLFFFFTWALLLASLRGLRSRQ